MHPPVIEVENIYKSFGKLEALSGVALKASKGTVFGLLGPNGAGKTTLVRIMTTLLKPDAGSIRIMGHDVVQKPMAVREIIGLAGQYAAVDENLTGRENLTMVGRLYHLGRKATKKSVEHLLEVFHLASMADRKSGTYSGGMRRRLDLAASLIAAPPVLFLDEPTTGLDPLSRLELWTIIQQLVEGGTTLLLTTQYLEEADRLADNIAIIDHGRIIAEGTPAELKRKTGGHVLEVEVADPSMIHRVSEALAFLNEGAPHIDEANRRVTLPTKKTSALLLEAVRRLDSAHVEVANIAFHSPSLDDVFLTLTGKPKEPHA